MPSSPFGTNLHSEVVSPSEKRCQMSQNRSDFGLFRFEPEFEKKVATPTNGKKIGMSLKNQSTYNFEVLQQDPELEGVRKPYAEIKHPIKKLHNKKLSSMGMARTLHSNPQESAANKTTNQRFIKNSGAQMQSLRDLDRKTKPANP